MAQRNGATTIDRAEDEIFLTPRVIDQRAYEDLSGSLRSLVRDAAHHNEALIASTGEVKLLGAQIKEATRELQQRFEVAVRVVPTLDQRVAKAEQLIEKASTDLAAKEREVRDLVTREATIDRDRLAKVVDENLTSIVREKLSDFTERLVRQAVDAGPIASRELEATFERLKSTQARLQSANDAAEQRVERLTTKSDAIAQEILGMVRSHAARLIDDAQARSETIVAEAQRQADARLSEAHTQSESMLAEAQRRIDTLLAHFETRAADSARRIHEPLSQLLASAPARLAECEEQARQALAETETRVDRLRTQARDVSQTIATLNLERLAADHQAAEIRSRDLIAQLSAAVLKAADSGRQLSAMAQQAEVARHHLADDVLGAADRIDSIEARLAEITSTQSQVGESLQRALSKAGEADASLDAHAKRCAASIEQAAQPALQRLGQQAQQVGQWLTQLIQQTADVGHRLERTISEARAAANGKTPRP